MARKAMIEQVKMLCMSNKEEITKIDFSITNFLKITCSSFAAFIWKWATASASFCFCSSENDVLVI